MKHVIKNVRVVYPSLFEKNTYEEDVAKHSYQITCLLDKDSDEAKKLESALFKVAKDIFGDKKSPNGKMRYEIVIESIRGDRTKFPFRDGDTEMSSTTMEPKFPGYYFLKASNKKLKPIVKLLDGKTDAKAGDVYSGCYCDVHVNIWGKEDSKLRLLHCQLRAVQFKKDGEPYGHIDVVSDDEFEQNEVDLELSDDDIAF